jgi:hypothetical protein
MTTFAILSRRGGNGVPVSGGFSDIPGPAGSLSITANWGTQPGASDYLLLYDTVTRAFGDRSYAYRKLFAGGSTASGTVTGLASGTYYMAVAAVESGVMGDLSHEYEPETAV